MSLDSIMDKVNELFNSRSDKLSKRNDAIEAMVIALKKETMATTMPLSTRIEDLEVKLALCRAAIGEGVSSAAPSNEDILKLKEFMGIRYACHMDNFLWKMENYLRAKSITDDAVKAVSGQPTGRVRPWPISGQLKQVPVVNRESNGRLQAFTNVTR
ncbi:hypothetical protein J1N35_014721 [Gossypium stocksii]|uniref:Uncharacterized protein n=1 Tax=Gossypium stocksii TaxID=47602 RepID=A0A9D3VVB0_9ROSI|nr:hypothetical protein J1N35_014721 [Gossypium stocksii]